jgi:hypothetical protein
VADHRTQPDPSTLLAELDLDLPLIGFYDAPDPTAFAPIVEPGGAGRGPCVFDFFRRWQRGETLHLTRETYGCGGAGRALCGAPGRPREAFIDFLWKDEGLRATRELMAGWIDAAPAYHMEHDHVLIGPLRPEQAAYLKTVTFWVNADQLSLLQHGAYHHHAWGDPDPVTVPFGSGCMELVVTFRDLERPQAAIGGTDVAMRDQLPPGALAFTVTVPLFAQLCALDHESFLGKGFLRELRKARGGSLRTPPAAAP